MRCEINFLLPPSFQQSVYKKVIMAVEVMERFVISHEICHFADFEAFQGRLGLAWGVELAEGIFFIWVQCCVKCRAYSIPLNNNFYE